MTLKKIQISKLMMILSTMLTITATIPSTAQARTDRHFTHNIQGVIPGRSRSEDVTNKMGKPISKQTTINGTNYHYKNMTVNVNKKNKVNTIIFNKPSNFKDDNGISVGDRLSKVETRVSQLRKKSNYLIDNQHGIIYWHNGRQITKIVLAESFYID